MARRWQVLAVTSLGVFMAFLDTTIVNIAFTEIVRDYAATPISTLSWVLNGYTVLFAAALIPLGRFADRAGRRRVFLAGLAVFTVASALSGLAPSAGALIAARLLQGVGAAAMIPPALGLVLPEFPPTQRATAVGLWSMAGALAGAAGTPLGGLIVDLAGWRWIFLVNVPLGVVTFLLARRTLVERRESGARRLPDLLGAAMLAAAVGSLALGIVKAEDWGWLSARTLAAFAVAVALALLFVARSARHEAPVMELDLWRVRSFAVANVATLVYAMGFFALFLASALFLTNVWGYSTVQAGLAIAPGPALAGVVGAVAGRIADRRGQRSLIVLGQLLVAAGLLSLVLRAEATPDFLGVWLPAFVVSGVGVGLTLPSLSSAAVAALSPARFATGGAVNNTFRQIGAVLGVAVLIAILGRPRPDEALDAFRAGFAFSAVCALACSAVALTLGRVRALTATPVAPATAPEPLPAALPPSNAA